MFVSLESTLREAEFVGTDTTHFDFEALKLTLGRCIFDFLFKEEQQNNIKYLDYCFKNKVNINSRLMSTSSKKTLLLTRSPTLHSC